MGLEIHNFPEWPATMDRTTALAYSGVADTTLRQFEARGIVLFLPVGPHGKNTTPKAQLDAMLAKLWESQGALPANEDFTFA